jgi:hypothetical protein
MNFKLRYIVLNYRSLLVAVSHSEIVLEDRIHDATNAEGGFDHVGHHLLRVHRLLALLHAHHVFGERETVAAHVQRELAANRKLRKNSTAR